MIIDQLPELTNIFDTDEIPIERGTNTYKTKISTFFSGLRDLIAARVAKSGDTMTGNLEFNNSILNLKSNTIDETAQTQDAVRNYLSFNCLDKNGAHIADIYEQQMQDGEIRLCFTPRRKIGTTNYYNSVNLGIANDGSRTVSFSDATPWRKALALGTDGALPITVDQGGTGQTAVTETTALSTIATAGSNVTILASNFVQWGKIGQLRLAIKATAAISAGTVVATLVSNKKPKTTTFIGATQANRSGYISTTGAISLCQSLAADATVTLLATYILT